MRKSRIIYYTGGPAFHPVAEQAAAIAMWAGDENCDHGSLILPTGTT